MMWSRSSFPRLAVVLVTLGTVTCGRVYSPGGKVSSEDGVACPLVVNESATLLVTHGALSRANITVSNCSDSKDSLVVISTQWSSGRSREYRLKAGQETTIPDQCDDYGVLNSVAAMETVVHDGLVRSRRKARVE